MIFDWLDLLAGNLAQREPVVLVSILGTRGSAPRSAGTRMVVTGQELAGTIGGGHLEYHLIQKSREMLEDPRPSWVIHRLSLGASLGQCCGGAVEVLLEYWPCAARVALQQVLSDYSGTEGLARENAVLVLDRQQPDQHRRWLVTAQRTVPLINTSDSEAAGGLPAAVLAAAEGMAGNGVKSTGSDGYLLEHLQSASRSLLLFGAGHVARAIVAVLGGLPVQVTWYDSRIHEFPASIPANVQRSSGDDFHQALSGVDDGCHALVMTHSHSLDQEIVNCLLHDPRIVYCGLIGSDTKRRLFEKRLLARGLPPDQLDRLYCPVGLPGLGGKLPGEIAVSVVADLLMRWGGSG